MFWFCFKPPAPNPYLFFFISICCRTRAWLRSTLTLLIWRRRRKTFNLKPQLICMFFFWEPPAPNPYPFPVVCCCCCRTRAWSKSTWTLLIWRGRRRATNLNSYLIWGIFFFEHSAPNPIPFPVTVVVGQGPGQGAL